MYPKLFDRIITKNIKVLFVLLSIILAATSAYGQSLAYDSKSSESEEIKQILLMPAGFVFDGLIDEWKDMRPSFSLHKKVIGGRDGDIWVSQTDQGLMIAGRVRGSPPNWPKSSDDMALGDHIEVWLSDAEPVRFPSVGWRHRFGDERLYSEDDCKRIEAEFSSDGENNIGEECKKWFKKQVKYRSLLSKLFVRQWQVSPNIAIETYASHVFDSFKPSIQDSVKPLQPSGAPQIKINENVMRDSVYSFELLIPWNIFPPMHLLKVRDIRLLVDIFSPGTGRLEYGPFSTSSESRKYGVVATFNNLQIADPREYFVTPCKYDLQDLVIAHGPDKVSPMPDTAYFFPNQNRDVREIVVLDNMTAWREYWLQEYSISPIAFVKSHFVKHLDDNTFLCSPRLTYSKNNRIYKSAFILDSEEYFETRVLEEGDILVRDGPRTWQGYWGLGMCGACPWASLEMYHIDDETGQIDHVFRYEKRIDGFEIDDIDIWVSDDWDTITIFEAQESRDNYQDELWYSTSYCYQKGMYVQCGKKVQVEEPSPRNITPVLDFSG